MKSFTAPIASIRRDGGTQIRAALDEATVAEYAEAIKAGVKLPPAVVFDDEKTLWLADGFHRIEAEMRAGKKNITIERKAGSQRDAILYAVGANAAHGLRRSHADKRRAVEALLADPEWAQWTDRAIAKAANVGDDLVAPVREECAALRNNVVNDNATHRVTADGREYPAKQRPRDSKPGQPTAAPVPAANPVDEGEKGAGAPSDNATRICAPVPAAPAPHEPRDRLVNVERLLRDAQAEIAPLLAKGEYMSVQAALDAALWVVRKALGDGVEVRVMSTAIIDSLKPGQPVVAIQQKAGRYAPPEKRLHVELPDGHEYEPVDDTDAFQ